MTTSDGALRESAADLQPVMYVDYSPDPLARSLRKVRSARSLINLNARHEPERSAPVSSPEAEEGIRRRIDDAVARNTMRDPFGWIARTPGATIPRFSDFFRGALYAARGDSYAVVLMDMRSPRIEHFLRVTT
jgi:hypothetical protein